MDQQEELSQLKERVSKLEAENSRLWDIIKAYFTRNISKGAPTSLPKVKLPKKTWVLIILWNVVGIFLKGIPEELLF
jgi:hypothetical protein